jgi:hypothetical protein
MILFLGFMVPGWEYALSIVLVTIVSGIFVLKYLKYYKDFVLLKRLEKLQVKDPAILKQLQEKRRKIIEMI